MYWCFIPSVYSVLRCIPCCVALELSPGLRSSQVGVLGCSQARSSPPRQGERRTAEGQRWGAVGWCGLSLSARLRGSYLDELSVAGECAAEYLALYQKLITSAHWKVYLAARGVLPYVGNLITKVCRPGPTGGAPSPSPALLVLFLCVNSVVVFYARKRYLLKMQTYLALLCFKKKKRLWQPCVK